MEMSIDVEKGQAAYTPWNLNVEYDLFVLLYSNRFVWKCPTSDLLNHFNANVSNNHLEVGVGTGYYPAHARFPTTNPRLALMDINENCLKRTCRRVHPLTPKIYRRNILEPLAFDGPGFSSIGMTYLLHCLPGSMEEKAVAFDHLLPLMEPGAVLFGATIVQGDVPVGREARRLMDIYNRKGFFSNRQDTASSLETALKARFPDTTITIKGCVAKFRCHL